MAIHIERPNQIGNDINEMYNVTNSTGKKLMNDFASIITSLNNNWKGTDAVANLADLTAVYRDTAALVKKLQKIIAEVNNGEIIPLQKHIQLCGGECTPNGTLSDRLDIADTVSVQTSATASITNDGILNDASNFNSFPEKFIGFADDLKNASKKLLNNWLDGANREAVVTSFNTFETNVGGYVENLKKVRNNLNTVAENKKQFLN